jgi:hypothetical protein
MIQFFLSEGVGGEGFFTFSPCSQGVPIMFPKCSQTSLKTTKLQDWKPSLVFSITNQNYMTFKKIGRQSNMD